MSLDLYWTSMSAPCRVAALAAKASGVKFNLVNVDLMKGEQNKPAFLKMNPQHTVPTLNDAGFVVNESRTIATYLITKYAKNDALYPRDAKRRAIIDQRLYFDVGTLYTRLGKVVYPVMFGGVKKSDPEEMKKLMEALGWLEGYLNVSEYVAGSTLTVADISIATTVSTAEACGIDFSAFPRLRQWLNRMRLELDGWDELNAAGAAIFGGFYKSKAGNQ